MISVPELLLIGAAGRNVGKTELACQVISVNQTKHKLIGLKVTTVVKTDGSCPRGGEGCGVCSSLKTPFLITEEIDSEGNKDTHRMLRAGASKVLWLRVQENFVEEGIKAVLEMVDDELIVCESNSLRQVIEPGLFLMVKDKNIEGFKKSAQTVLEYADHLIMFDNNSHDIDPDWIVFEEGQWMVRLPAAAIIMAGGMSSRMGSDKSMLDIDGKPMIGHIEQQLGRLFKTIYISTNTPERYAFLGRPCVADIESGQGPLMGIMSALMASEFERNFIVACDIPDLDLNLIRRMFCYEDEDIVVPESVGGRFETLFAWYRKNLAKEMKRLLDSNKRRITLLFDRCKVKTIPVEENDWLLNINTPEEYRSIERKYNDFIQSGI